jgi:hypothetical protein
MAIKFICSCGKHLRARDEMAMRRSVCPACGNPVGIPSLGPATPGLLGPMTPQERRRRARQPVPAESSAPPSEAITTTPNLTAPPRPLSPAPPKRAARRRPWPRETHWAECLLYPFRAGLMILRLAFLLTVFSASSVLVVPLVMGRTPVLLRIGGGIPLEAPSGLLLSLLVGSAYSLAVVFFVSYTCAFLQCVLAFGTAGEAAELGLRGRDLRYVLTMAVRWLVCFLAGPVVPAVAAILYWFNGGDLGVLDWIIIAELGVLAMGWWLLTILAVSRRGRLRDANPVRVIEVIRRLGFRVLLSAGVWGGLLLGHGLAGFLCLERLHENVLLGLGWLSLCWIGLLFCATFLFRLLGLWCYRNPWWTFENRAGSL